MPFDFSIVKDFANKLKGGISTDSSSLRQGSHANNIATSSTKSNGLSNVIQSVKTGSIAVGKQIVQSAESFIGKNTNIITVVINAQQLTYIIDNLEVSYNELCIVKKPIQLDTAIISKGLSLYSVQGVLVDYCSYELIHDLFYMIRNKRRITLQFTNTPMKHPEHNSTIDLYQCAIFYYRHFDTVKNAHSACIRRSVVSNHYLTLRTLAHMNPSLDISIFLSSQDPEHVIVAERLFIHYVRFIISHPIISIPLKGVFNPNEIEQVMTMIPIHLKSIVDFIMYYCYVMYNKTGFFPDIEFMYILCKTNTNTNNNTNNNNNMDIAYFTSLVLCWGNWLETNFSLQSEIQITRYILTIPHATLIYSSPSLLDSAHISKIATSISKMDSCSLNAFLNDNSSLSSTELFSILLRRLNVYLLADWMNRLIYNAMKVKTKLKKMQSVRSVIQMLPLYVQTELYWLLRCITTSHADERVYDSIVKFWFCQKNGENIKEFLHFSSQYLDFLFLPQIPSFTNKSCLTSSIEDLDSLSLNSSFADMHAYSQQMKERNTNIHVLDTYYSQHVNISMTQEKSKKEGWFEISHLLIQQSGTPPPLPTKTVKPPLPPKSN